MYVLLLLIGLHVAISILGFSRPAIFQRLVFRINALVVHRQWERLITSGFLHVDVPHLFFNMFSLYLFSEVFLASHTVYAFLLIYFSSLIFGNVLSFVLHKHHLFYQAAGASGGVSGLVFSTILLHPQMELAFIFLPFFFPGWVFALGFLLYTFYGLVRGKDRIGHDAHLGGAMAGSLFTLVLFPEQVLRQPWFLGLALGLPLIFLAVQQGWQKWFQRSKSA